MIERERVNAICVARSEITNALDGVEYPVAGIRVDGTAQIRQSQQSISGKTLHMFGLFPSQVKSRYRTTWIFSFLSSDEVAKSAEPTRNNNKISYDGPKREPS